MDAVPRARSAWPRSDNCTQERLIIDEVLLFKPSAWSDATCDDQALFLYPAARVRLGQAAGGLVESLQTDRRLARRSAGRKGGHPSGVHHHAEVQERILPDIKQLLKSDANVLQA